MLFFCSDVFTILCLNGKTHCKAIPENYIPYTHRVKNYLAWDFKIYLLRKGQKLFFGIRLESSDNAF